MVNTRARSKKTQHSGALIGSNDDLLIEILLRLPVTSILRFKSVSKHWLWLLSDRHFTLRYKKASISPGFFVDDFYIPCDDQNQSPPPFRDLDFDHRGIRIVQSCNGLLLCCSKWGIPQRDYKYYVLNPTTKQFALIPSVPGGGEVRRTIRFMGLAFHPTDCVHYKVVCIRYIKRDVDLFQIQIYSSDTRKWKISDASIFEPFHQDFYGVYWHQAFHLVSTCGNPCYLKLDTGELKLLPLPEGVESVGRYRPHYCGESRGHLHLIDRMNRRVSLQLNVYEMLSDHSGWFVKYRVELDEVLHAYPEMISRINPSVPNFYDYQVLDVVRGEEEIETFMVIRIARKVIRYNVHDKSFKQILNLNRSIHGPLRCSEIHRYIETIVCF